MSSQSAARQLNSLLRQLATVLRRKQQRETALNQELDRVRQRHQPRLAADEARIKSLQADITQLVREKSDALFEPGKRLIKLFAGSVQLHANRPKTERGDDAQVVELLKRRHLLKRFTKLVRTPDWTAIAADPQVRALLERHGLYRQVPSESLILRPNYQQGDTVKQGDSLTIPFTEGG